MKRQKYRRGYRFCILVLTVNLFLNIFIPVSHLDAEETLDEVGAEPDQATEVDPHRVVPIDISGKAYYDQARSLLAKVNELRASLDVAPLVFNFQLEDLAVLRAAESSVYWSHERPDGSYICQDNDQVQGENLEGGKTDPQLVFDSWVNSPDHYAEMVNPEYVSVGIAAYGSLRAEVPHCWCQLFSDNLPETTLPERSDGQLVSHRIEVDPELLNLKILTGDHLDVLRRETDFGQAAGLRQQVGDELWLYGLIHYAPDDACAWPGSLSPDALIWKNDNPEVAKLDPSGMLTCLAEGTTTIHIRHTDLPELEAKLKINVLPIDKFQLLAGLSEEKSANLWKECQSLYQAKPHVIDYKGESTAEAHRLREEEYRFYDKLRPDSTLDRLAFELAKQYSLCSNPDGIENLPEISRILSLLSGKNRLACHVFSGSDQLADQKFAMPGWAHSMACWVLESGGGSEISFLLFSDHPGDGEHLQFTDLVSEENILDLENNTFSYPVSVFKNCNHTQLMFVHAGLPLKQLDIYSAEDPGIEALANGQLTYRLDALAYWDDASSSPPVSPDPSYFFYEIDQPELASFTEDGRLLIKGAGSFNLRLDMVDADRQDVIASISLPVNNYVEIPEVKSPFASELKPPEVEVASDTKATAGEDFTAPEDDDPVG